MFPKKCSVMPKHTQNRLTNGVGKAIMKLSSKEMLLFSTFRFLEKMEEITIVKHITGMETIHRKLSLMFFVSKLKTELYIFFFFNVY